MELSQAAVYFPEALKARPFVMLSPGRSDRGIRSDLALNLKQ